MAQIIQERNPYGELGASLGIGLQALGQQKLKQLQQQHTAQVFQEAGYDAPTAKVLAHIAATDPKGLSKILQSLGTQESPQPNQQPDQQEAGRIQQLVGEEQAIKNMGVAGQQQQSQVQQPKPGTFAQQLAKSKELTPAQLKHRDLVSEQYDINQDLYDTADRMIQELDSGKVSTGLIATAKSKLAPSWLGRATEQFDKDSAHILNLSASKIKGIRSKYAVQTLQKEKPGVEHSPEVNRQILNRIKKEAAARNKTISRDYSKYGFGSESSEPKQESPQQDYAKAAAEGRLFEDENGNLVIQ